MDNRKISRRGFARIAAGTAVGLVVGGIVGYAVSLSQLAGQVMTVTRTVKETVTVTSPVTQPEAAPMGPPKEMSGVFFPFHYYGTILNILEQEGILEKWAQAFNVKITGIERTIDDLILYSAKKADINNSSPYEAMFIHSQNKNDPAYHNTIFAKLQGVFLGLYTSRDDINSIADLRGKKLGIGSFGGCEWTGWAPYAVMIEGIDLREEAEVVTAGYFALPDLIAKGEVDAGLSAPNFGVVPYLMEGVMRDVYGGKEAYGNLVYVWSQRTGHLGPACTSLLMYTDFFRQNRELAEMWVGAWQEAVDRFFSDVEGYIRKNRKIWALEGKPPEVERAIIEWVKDEKGATLFRDITLDEKWIEGETEFMELVRESGIISKEAAFPYFEIIKPGRKP